MVLGGDDDAARAGLSRDATPLVAIQIRWMEQILCLGAMPPFNVGECIGAKVAEKIELCVVPAALGRTGHRRLAIDGCLGYNQQQRKKAAKHGRFYFVRKVGGEMQKAS